MKGGSKAAKGKNTGWCGLEGRGPRTSQGGEGEGGGIKRMRKREEEKGAPPIEREGGREGGCYQGREPWGRRVHVCMWM
jgi:hypothetical protein